MTKIQHRTSGPHRGGIPFERGSLFHLLKNPIYQGKIVHKGMVYEGEHDAIVGCDLWERVQMHLNEKAPSRKRPTNDRQNALLHGLLADGEGRQVVPTYATKGTRRYSYYETRKDLALPNDPPSTRFSQGALDAHLLARLDMLLNDEHALRRLANLDEAQQLRTLFACAKLIAARLERMEERSAAIQQLIALIGIHSDRLELTLRPKALGFDQLPCLTWSIPLPSRRPFRDAKLRIDAAQPHAGGDPKLTSLLTDASEVQKLVLAWPELSLNQLATKSGRCRKQIAKLLRLSWLSPILVEAIIDGSQPKALNRKRLLETDLPIAWAEQEALFGYAA